MENFKKIACDVILNHPQGIYLHYPTSKSVEDKFCKSTTGLPAQMLHPQSFILECEKCILNKLDQRGHCLSTRSTSPTASRPICTQLTMSESITKVSLRILRIKRSLKFSFQFWISFAILVKCLTRCVSVESEVFGVFIIVGLQRVVKLIKSK